MKVHVQFFSHLRDAAGLAELEVPVEAGAKVEHLLAQLYHQFPKLRDWDQSILVGAGVEFVQRDYVLREGDEIAVMPPVQGG